MERAGAVLAETGDPQQVLLTNGSALLRLRRRQLLRPGLTRLHWGADEGKERPGGGVAVFNSLAVQQYGLGEVVKIRPPRQGEIQHSGLQGKE